MYHFPHESFLHHNSHNEYQRYGNFDHEKSFVPNNQTHSEYGSGVQQNNDVPQASESRIPPSELAETTTKKAVPCKKIKKGPVDTSNFSVEERVVAAVWVHERKNTKCSISRIKQDFRERFGREPPAKNTLLVWERKLFSTGSVHDAPRPGRPIKRAGAAAVLASVKGAPSLSMRARARALGLPRTTLRTILMRDLGRPPSSAKKETSGKRTKNPLAKKPPLQTLSCELRPVSGQHYFQGYT